LPERLNLQFDQLTNFTFYTEGWFRIHMRFSVAKSWVILKLR